MALTEKQKQHLKAIVKDATEEVNPKAVKSAQKILDTKKWPDMKDKFPDEDYIRPCHIHDYLEKDKDGNKWQTP